LRREKERRGYFRRRYGMKLEALEMMLQEQDGCCAICRKHWTACKAAKHARDKNLFLHYVDHDHTRNSVRGLLCNSCNIAIGLFEEDLERFTSAMAYLTLHAGRPNAEPAGDGA
jgi:Recombination endonuclease VII